jgi:purine-binding chemotaxis protein CheW
MSETQEINAIMKARAREMALEPTKLRDTATSMEIIEFSMGLERYGIESKFIKAVLPLVDLTFLPGVPEYIRGIIHSHGQIMAVVDMKKMMYLTDTAQAQSAKIIILANNEMEFGMLVDEIYGTSVIYEEDILPVPATYSSKTQQFAQGITTEHLVLLSAIKILTDKQLLVNEK